MQQPSSKQTPIALFAGKGELPRILINAFKSENRPFLILAFKGQTEENLVKDHPHIWLYFGEAGKALRYMQENHIQDIVMAGTITRPAMSEVRPDWEGVKWLTKIGSKALGDDNLLKLLIHMIEERGYRIVGPDDILADLLAPEGLFTSHEPGSVKIRMYSFMSFLFEKYEVTCQKIMPITTINSIIKPGSINILKSII